MKIENLWLVPEYNGEWEIIYAEENMMQSTYPVFFRFNTMLLIRDDFDMIFTYDVNEEIIHELYGAKFIEILPVKMSGVIKIYLPDGGGDIYINPDITISKERRLLKNKTMIELHIQYFEIPRVLIIFPIEQNGEIKITYKPSYSEKTEKPFVYYDLQQKKYIQGIIKEDGHE